MREGGDGYHGGNKEMEDLVKRPLLHHKNGSPEPLFLLEQRIHLLLEQKWLNNLLAWVMKLLTKRKQKTK